MYKSIFFQNVKVALMIIIVGMIVGGLCMLGTNVYALITIIIATLFTIGILHSKFKEGIILTLTLMCAFIPQIYSVGFKISSINISITDFVLAGNFFYLLIRFKLHKIMGICKQYSKITTIFIWMILLLIVNLSWSINFNDFGLAIKLIRTLLYSFFIYLLFVVSYKKTNVTNYIIILGIVASIATIFTYRNVVISTGEYRLFRNSETFIVSALCYLIIILTLTKTTILQKSFSCITIISLIGAIIVEQDRVQIVAVLVSLTLTITFLLFKKMLSIRKLMKIIIFILLVFCILYLFVHLIDNQGVNNMLKSYYNNRIAILFGSNNNIQLDTSLSFRTLEYKDIINSVSQNFATLFWGKGLAATYLGGLTVVDSFWFWIILNLGLTGLLLFFYLFYFIFKTIVINKKTIESAPIFAYFCATCVTTITIPNMIYRVDDSVSMGILLGLLHLTLINNQENDVSG